MQAERRVEKEVARRLELIGMDEAQWPQAARDALARRAQKLEAVRAMLTRLQNELDAEQHHLASEQAARASLQVRGRCLGREHEVAARLVSNRWCSERELACAEQADDR